MARASRWLAAALLCLPGMAAADQGSKLDAYEAEARQLAANLPTPNAATPQESQRRQVDAEVAFALGDYDEAALALFELAARPGPDQERALYYLAESLLAKGDRGAARTYFNQVVAGNNQFGKHYQLALIRLVEIGIALSDTTQAEQALAALDRLSPSARLPQVVYVKGKWAFAQGKPDEALALFRDVGKGATHELQALYYTGAAQVANKDTAAATTTFTDLVGRRPKTAADRRVIELAQLALGRVYYERDQMSKSIDSYLLVDRNSDLFPAALYEVAWVYVKSKQFDKALRALELLSLSDPTSEKTATVRILEGNLRIRKARMIREAQLAGTLDAGPNDPSIEYDKAAKVFADTHDAYHPSYLALEEMMKSPEEASAYLAQLAGRSATVFQTVAPIPEAAAQYLREEPEVRLAVANQADLAAIHAHLIETEQTIARLEGVIAAGDRTVVYPQLAGRRQRIGQLENELIAFRNDIANQQVAQVAGGGALAQATAQRKALAAQFASTPVPEVAQSTSTAAARARYDELDAGLGEVSGQLDSSQAIAVAVRTFVVAPPTEGAAGVTPEQKAAIKTELAAISLEAHDVETELAELRREAVLGRDLAGIGDDTVVRARQLRVELIATQDAEQRLLAAAGGPAKLTQLAERAGRIVAQLQQTEATIDGVVARAMTEATLILRAERAKIDGYKLELAEHEKESIDLGGAILGASFATVKAKFYDVAIRTDVGSVDVLWSQKEDADADLKKLQLSRQRELKGLRDEFKDILDASQLNAPGTLTSTPVSDGTAPTTSPDQGGAQRVNPGGDPRPVVPTVRPDSKPATTPPGGAR